MVNKQDFFDHMSALYDEDFNDNDVYRTLKSIIKLKDDKKINELKDLVHMSKKERLAYRYAMAANGKELTPKQVDQYISMIEYAISHM